MHDDMTRRGPTRRTVLAGATVLATPFIIGSEARAQANRMVLGTWGGDYARLLNENVEQPLLQGVEVVQDVSDEPTRTAKLQAQRRLPRGGVDVACLQAVAAYQMAEMGMLEELDTAKIPNLVHLDPSMKTATFAPHIYSPQVIIYNPERVPAPPTTFTDLLDSKYSGKIGFPDANYFYAMMAASLSASGGPNDMDKAKELMTKLNANKMRLYPSTDAAGPPFRTGELDAGIMWLARVIMWQNAGIPVKAAFPKEGCILYVTGMVVPKNAPNKDAAYKYLNAMLEPAAQRGFAQHMGYLPTVKNAPLSGKVAEQLAFPDPAPKLVAPDYAFTTKVQPDMADWWKKTIQTT
ncbi:MAG: extracellular solute-binding protein [Gemmatimonadaceae bacterium]|nr:extracellular solute-binding protein [Acetobacteraceae bacterium]